MGGKGLKYYKKDFEVDAQTSGLNLRSFVQDKSHEDTIKSAVRNTIRRRKPNYAALVRVIKKIP